MKGFKDGQVLSIWALEDVCFHWCTGTSCLPTKIMCVVRGCNVGRLRFLHVFSFQTWEGVLRWLAGICTIFRCMSFGKLGFLVRQGISWFSFSFLTSNTWVGANLHSDVGTKYPTLPHEFNYPTTQKQHPRAVFWWYFFRRGMPISKKRSFITCWKFNLQNPQDFPHLFSLFFMIFQIHTLASFTTEVSLSYTGTACWLWSDLVSCYQR